MSRLVASSCPLRRLCAWVRNGQTSCGRRQLIYPALTSWISHGDRPAGKKCRARQTKTCHSEFKYATNWLLKAHWVVFYFFLFVCFEWWIFVSKMISNLNLCHRLCDFSHAFIQFWAINRELKEWILCLQKLGANLIKLALWVNKTFLGNFSL